MIRFGAACWLLDKSREEDHYFHSVPLVSYTEFILAKTEDLFD
jgi:hypothetical protein